MIVVPVVIFFCKQGCVTVINYIILYYTYTHKHQTLTAPNKHTHTHTRKCVLCGGLYVCVRERERDLRKDRKEE